MTPSTSTATSTPTATSGSRPSERPAPARVRAFAVLSIVTSLAILLQGVVAGQFVDKQGADGWITVHGVVADLSWVLALATAVVGAVSLRPQATRLVAWAGALFVVTLAQTGLGHLITDYGMDALIAVHVPLAVAIFGLTIWISLRAVRLLRTVSAPPVGQPN